MREILKVTPRLRENILLNCLLVAECVRLGALVKPAA